MTSIFSIAEAKAASDYKSYIIQYFVPLTNGKHAFKDANGWVILEDEVVQRTFFKRLPFFYRYFYFEQYDKLFTLISNPNKPVFYETYFNIDGKETAELLPLHKFILDEFINNKLGINGIKPADLFKQYDEYNPNNTMKKQQFTDALLEVNIKPVKSGTNVYKLTYDELINIAYKNNWILQDKKDIQIAELKEEIERLKAITSPPVVKIEDSNDEFVVEYVEGADASTDTCDLPQEKIEDENKVIPITINPKTKKTISKNKSSTKTKKQPIIVNEIDDDNISELDIDIEYGENDAFA